MESKKPDIAHLSSLYLPVMKHDHGSLSKPYKNCWNKKRIELLRPNAPVRAYRLQHVRANITQKL
jgi:hypothetical protein